MSCKDQPELRAWLCAKLGLTPTPDIQCIGSVDEERGILGVVGFDQFNGSSIVMHVAGEPGWLTRSLIWASFDYPFNKCKVKVIFAPVASGNTKSLRFVTKLGFTTIAEVPDAHPDGALVFLAMRREQCRYLLELDNG